MSPGPVACQPDWETGVLGEGAGVGGTGWRVQGETSHTHFWKSIYVT